MEVSSMGIILTPESEANKTKTRKEVAFNLSIMYSCKLVVITL